MISKQGSITNYTVVIPHYNIPDLLSRCLLSIPQRNDIQVLVVDDNSPGADEYSERLPELGRRNVRLIRAPKRGGAGYARNMGLQDAFGTWVMFADADDFFLPGAWDTFDKYLDSPADIVFYKFRAVMSDDPSVPSQRLNHFNRLLDDTKAADRSAELCADFQIPSCKMIRRALLGRHPEIRFEEIPFSNDVMFAARLSQVISAVEICHEAVYALTERPGSLSYGIGWKPGEAECRTMAEFRVHKLLGRGKRNWSRVTVQYFWEMLKMDPEAFDRCFLAAPQYGFPRWRAISRVIWNSRNPWKGVRLLQHCARLQFCRK